MFFIEKIKQYRWLIVSLMAAAGLGVFLYLQTHPRSAVNLAPQNSLAVKNSENPTDNGQAAAPVAENSPVVAGSDTNVDSAPAVPEQNKTEPIQSSPAPKAVESLLATGTIVRKLVSFGFQAAAGRTIDTIIIHSSYDALGSDPYDVNGLIAEYKSYGVAPHYLIDRQGTIYQLVADQNIAYHAGVGKTPDGRAAVNSFSLGIEMMNTKTGQYTDAQYASLNKLLGILKSKYKIKYVLGHNQIAPGRKDDPWNFNWGLIKSNMP